MKRILLLTAVFALVGPTLHAQYVPSGLPTYGNQSALPYVNLMQPNVNPAVTYMGIVQPQLQAQAAFQQMQGQINTARTMPGGVAPPRNVGVADTGQAPARFMSYQQYFNTVSSMPRGNYPAQGAANASYFGSR